MTLHKIPRKVHQERAQRIEARFSPTWTGDPASPTVTVLPNDPAPPAPPSKPPPPAPAPAPTTPAGPVAPPVRPTTGPVLPVTTPAAVVTPVVPSITPTLSTPVVPTSLSSIPSIVQTTPTIIATPTSKLITSVPTPTTFRSLPESAAVTFLTTSSASPTASAAPSSSGMSTGSIVGIAAGSIAGVALVGALAVWIVKRWFNARDEQDDVNGGGGGFSRHSWMRNSVALADDVPSPMVRGGMGGGMGGPSESPRPPTMIERKQTQNYANLPPSRQQYGQGNMGMGYSDYQDSPYGAPPPMPGYNPGQQPGYNLGQQPGYNPGQHYGAPSPHSAQGFFSPISPPPPSPGMASFDETMPPVQHAAGMPAYFSRHDSNLSTAQPDSAALPDMPNPHADGYATLDRSSVTPYQAEQYAEISRQLDVVQPLPTVSEMEPAPPAPQAHSAQQHVSPFADPAYPDLTTAPLPDLAVPPAAHPRVDSTPPTLPPMRAMSPVGQATGNASFAQLANAFPATPAVPPPAASSPRSPTFPPASPVVGAHKSPVVTVPDVHVGRETPVQFGFNQPASAPAPAPAKGAGAHAPPPSRPETMYDEEDAYGGI